jgi:putative tryptophan/tyrosine transport system substrate-binding protein
MKRRDFIKIITGSAAAWSIAAHAQQGDRVRHIGAITSLSSNDPEGHARYAAFLQELQVLGWSVGRNIQVEYFWGEGNRDRSRKNATELVAMAPDVILATGSPTLEPLLQATHTVPIVFVQIADPVGAGYVNSLAHPGGTATGFTAFEYSIAPKWLELLKDIVPDVKRVAVLRDGTSAAGIGQYAAIQAVAPSLGVELRPIGVSDAAEIERMIDAFARDANGGMIVTESGPSIVHRELILALAARYRLPAVYPFRLYVTGGGLISYGQSTIEPYRLAAGYVDRILRGEKPADLPVQAPTKIDLVVNRKTARELGVTIPDKLLATADVIE